MFIPPMLSTTLRDPRRVGDPRYVAESTSDGQRAQVHIARERTVAAYSPSDCGPFEGAGALPGRS
jgi:hypothetical protein